MVRWGNVVWCVQLAERHCCWGHAAKRWRHTGSHRRQAFCGGVPPRHEVSLVGFRGSGGRSGGRSAGSEGARQGAQGKEARKERAWARAATSAAGMPAWMKAMPRVNSARSISGSAARGAGVGGLRGGRRRQVRAGWEWAQPKGHFPSPGGRAQDTAAPAAAPAAC